MERIVSYFNGAYTLPYRTEVLSPYDRDYASVELDETKEFVTVWRTEYGDDYVTPNDVEIPKRKSRLSDIYPYKGKFFRYNFTDALVTMMSKATEEELAEEEEWKRNHNGRGLMNYTDDGYYVWESVGLRKENWNNEEIRKEYLNEWIRDIDEECEYLAQDFIKNELPLYRD